MDNNRSIPINADGSVVTFTVKINGEVIPEMVQVVQITVSKAINKIAMAKVVISDGSAASEDFQWSNESLFVPGNEIELLAGHQSEEDGIFKGIIVKHGISIRQNGRTQLRLECKDVAYRLALKRSSRYFTEVTDTDAIGSILDEYSITNELADTNITNPELVQYHSFDWDFIISRAEVNAAFCVVDDGVFKLIHPDFTQEPVLALQFGATILEFDAEIDARTQYTTVKSQTWDADNQELVEIEAALTDIEETGNLTASELAETAGADEYILQHGGNISEAALQAWADAKMQKSRLAKVRGRVKFAGFAGIKPGNITLLSGVGDRFNGSVFVTGVRHSLAEGEWETDLQFGVDPKLYAEKVHMQAPSNSALLPAVSGLQIGIVTQIHDDPAGAYRILVEIPVLGAQAEGTWARVATVDAGENRGFFFRPAVGDEVLLGFLNENPNSAVVLGALHSSAKPSAIEPAEANAEKGYVSTSEIKWLFNDEDVSLQMATPKGNSLLLSEADGSVSIEDENGNKILLTSDGITLESAKDIVLKATGDVKIEGTNIENKANAAFKADGSAGGELTSSAIVKIQGSLVQIN